MRPLLLTSLAILTLATLAHAAGRRTCQAIENFDQLRIAAADCERHATPDGEWIEWIEFCRSADSGDGALYMKVKSGPRREYRYENVPASVWSEFASAPSAGRFFNQRIVKDFACSRR